MDTFCGHFFILLFFLVWLEPLEDPTRLYDFYGIGRGPFTVRWGGYIRYCVRSISSHSSLTSREHRWRNGPHPLSAAWSPVPWPQSSGRPPPWLPSPGAPSVRSGMQPGPLQRLHLGGAGAGPAPGPHPIPNLGVIPILCQNLAENNGTPQNNTCCKHLTLVE